MCFYPIKGGHDGPLRSGSGYPDVSHFARLHVPYARAAMEHAHSVSACNRGTLRYTFEISQTRSADESCPALQCFRPERERTNLWPKLLHRLFLRRLALALVPWPKSRRSVDNFDKPDEAFNLQVTPHNKYIWGSDLKAVVSLKYIQQKTNQTTFHHSLVQKKRYWSISPKFNRDLIVLRCVLCPNFEILTWISGKLRRG